MAAEIHRPEDVDGKQALHIVRRDIFQEILFIDAGRRDQAVEAAELADRLFDHPAAVVVAYYVALNIKGPAGPSQESQGSLPLFLMTAADATFQPRSNNTAAVARPMPDVPPLISTVSISSLLHDPKIR